MHMPLMLALIPGRYPRGLRGPRAVALNKLCSSGRKAMIKCSRYGQRHKGRGGWNYVFRGGARVCVYCPDCQTPEENAEAAINEATLEYAMDEQGRPMARHKIG